jgi:hypothetical protein
VKEGEGVRSRSIILIMHALLVLLSMLYLAKFRCELAQRAVEGGGCLAISDQQHVRLERENC